MAVRTASRWTLPYALDREIDSRLALFIPLSRQSAVARFFQVERPIGKAVVAFDPDHYEEAWIGLDREVEVVFRF